jgi:hypothetical protein
MDIIALKADMDANGLTDFASAIAYYSNDSTTTIPQKFMVNKRVLYGEFGLAIGLPIIAALEAQTQDPDPIVALQAKEVISLLNDLIPDGGVDISHPDAIAMVDQFVAGGVITSTVGDQMKALGQRIVSVGYDTFGEDVTDRHITAALEL